ncbi:hypothetical protein Dimus_018254 [Dionaea muscipula]
MGNCGVAHELLDMAIRECRRKVVQAQVNKGVVGSSPVEDVATELKDEIELRVSTQMDTRWGEVLVFTKGDVHKARLYGENAVYWECVGEVWIPFVCNQLQNVVKPEVYFHDHGYFIFRSMNCEDKA